MPKHILHHMIMVNFSRRQLLYPAAERLMGAGTETDEEVSVPKTIGIPMTPGMRLGMYVAWHNDTGKDLDSVFLKVTMLWTPKNQNPQPVNSLPIYMDVNLTVGGSNTFDVAPGQVHQVVRVHAAGRRSAARRRWAHARLRRARAVGRRGDRQGDHRGQAPLVTRRAT